MALSHRACDFIGTTVAPTVGFGAELATAIISLRASRISPHGVRTLDSAGRVQRDLSYLRSNFFFSTSHFL